MRKNSHYCNKVWLGRRGAESRLFKLGAIGLLVAVLLLLLGRQLAQGEMAGEFGSPAYQALPAGAAPMSTAVVATRAAAVLYDHGQPTVIEQYMLEMVNRARRDPVGEAARFGIGLNDGLSGSPISTAAKQPLAYNQYLAAAARAHSQWMLDTDTFSHTGVNGTTPSQRTRAAGYPYYAAIGENIAWKGWTVDISSLLVEYIEWQHAGFFKSPAHRLNLLRPEWREIGIGSIVGQFTEYNALMTTQDMGESDSSPACAPGSRFLVGVAYEDRDGNRFYTPGEGLGGVVVEIVGGSHYAVTSPAGGYALPLAGLSGTITVAVSGGGWPAGTTFAVPLAGQNVKFDLVYDPGAWSTPRHFVLENLPEQVPEGGSASFTVSLSEAPLASVLVAVERLSGDPDLTVADGSLLEFTPTDYQGKTVRLAAAEDDDTLAGSATFGLMALDGPHDIPDLHFNVYEVDDDIELVVAASGHGSTSPAGRLLVDTNDQMPFPLAALPTAGARFLGWAGDVQALDNARTADAMLSTDRDVRLTALFSGGDFDQDGLDDEWEMLHFGHLDQGADDNPSGDGHANLAKMLAGLSPLEDHSHLDIEVFYPGWNLVVPSVDQGGQTVGQLFGQAADARAWRWDARQRLYARAGDTLPAGRPVWILFKQPAALVADPR